jgi:predicted RNase H-like nuclease (RuvC/YqgF family)
MAAGNFELYVSNEKFTQELSQLDSKLGSLRGLVEEYQAKKEQARQVWGEEDENLAKAQNMCEAAIQAVNKKIQETQQSKDALQNILSSAQEVSGNIGSFLDDATAKIQSLLG